MEFLRDHAALLITLLAGCALWLAGDRDAARALWARLAPPAPPGPVGRGGNPTARSGPPASFAASDEDLAG